MKDHSKPKAAQLPAAPKWSRDARIYFSSPYGAVRVYTRRHLQGCPLTSSNQNSCRCPKWIYSKPRDGQVTVQAARTSSFTEACEVAQKLLKGFDPEIAEARAITHPEPGITIEDAVTRYLAALTARKLSASHIRTVRTIFARRVVQPYQRRHSLNPALLDFLDRYNPRALAPITRVEQISTQLIEEWAGEWHSNDLTGSVWRSIATTFFRWARDRNYLEKLPRFGRQNSFRVRRGNRCGAFSDDQYARLLATLPFCQPKRGHAKENYAARLRAFLELGRWAGMAVIDIVHFRPQLHLDSTTNVLTYRRHKNSQIAVIALPADVAARLRSIPAEEGSSAEQPMRFPDRSEKQNTEVWRDRFQKLCSAAKIGEIETEVGEVREAHPHMLRDTFAIDMISRGVALENVAKALGHATVQMTQKSYLFWIQKRINHCIADQRAALGRLEPPLAVEASGLSRRPFVH